MKNTKKRNYKKKNNRKKYSRKNRKNLVKLGGKKNEYLSVNDEKTLFRAERIISPRIIEKEIFKQQVDEYFEDVSDVFSRNVRFSNVYEKSAFDEMRKAINGEPTHMKFEELKFALFCFMAVYNYTFNQNITDFDNTLKLVFNTIFSSGSKYSGATSIFGFGESQQIDDKVAKNMLDHLKKVVELEYNPTYKEYTEIIEKYAKDAEGFTPEEFNKLFANTKKGGADESPLPPPPPSTPEEESVPVPAQEPTISETPEVENADIDTCPICLENIESLTNRTLPCQHNFHATCINGWLINKRNCPVCRTDVFTGQQQSDRQQNIQLGEYEQVARPEPDEISLARQNAIHAGETFRISLMGIGASLLYVVPGIALAANWPLYSPIASGGIAMATICGCLGCCSVPATFRNGRAYIEALRTERGLEAQEPMNR